MKRFITAIVLLSICLSLSAVSSLRIFELDHPVYDEMETLFVLEGKSSPMGSKPWTETDVQHLLARISPDSELSQNLKSRIEGYISEKDNGLIFNAVINPQLMVHSNKDSFNKVDDVAASSLLDDQAATIGLGYYYKNNIAMYMDASLGVAPADAGDDASKRLSSAFGSNIPFLPDSLNIMNFPYNAYFNAGSEALRLFIGRGQVEWGNGAMGNMMLGNTLPYHDYLSLTFTGSRHFSYQLLTSFFSHSANKKDESDREIMRGLRFFLGHRFEFAFFNDKLTFAVNDGIMYQAENGYFDLRLLNPLFFMHNGFMAYHSNSLLTLEAEYSPIKNLSIYAQLGIDDLAVAGEPKPGESGGSANGVGAMAGLRWTVPVSEKSYGYGNAEFVYTSPYMYHRALKDDGGTNDLYYVSSNRFMNNGLKFVERYLSFPFGSDAIVCQVQAGYNAPGLYDIKAKASFMAHGVMDKNSTIRQYKDGEKVVHAPSTSNPLAVSGNEDKGGVIEYTLRTGVEAEYRPVAYLPINAGIYLITVWNKGNYSVPVSFDVQFNLGFKLIH